MNANRHQPESPLLLHQWGPGSLHHRATPGAGGVPVEALRLRGVFQAAPGPGGRTMSSVTITREAWVRAWPTPAPRGDPDAPGKVRERIEPERNFRGELEKSGMVDQKRREHSRSVTPSARPASAKWVRQAKGSPQQAKKTTFDTQRLDSSASGSALYSRPNVTAQRERRINQSFPVAPFQYLESHDHPRFINQFGQLRLRDLLGEFYGDRQRFYKMQPYVIALYTAKGIPMLWNGSLTARNSSLFAWSTWTLASTLLRKSTGMKWSQRNNRCPLRRNHGVGTV